MFTIVQYFCNIYPVSSCRDNEHKEKFYILDRFQAFKVDESGKYYGQERPVEKAPYDLFGGGIIKAHMIKWCQSFSKSSWEPAGTVVMYGNEAAVGLFYQAAAILIGIPKWGKSRQILAGVYDEGKDVQAVDDEGKDIQAVDDEGKDVQAVDDEGKDVQAVGDEEMDAESVDDTSDDINYTSDEEDIDEDSDKVFMKIFGQRLD